MQWMHIKVNNKLPTSFDSDTAVIVRAKHDKMHDSLPEYFTVSGCGQTLLTSHCQLVKWDALASSRESALVVVLLGVGSVVDVVWTIAVVAIENGSDMDGVFFLAWWRLSGYSAKSESSLPSSLFILQVGVVRSFIWIASFVCLLMEPVVVSSILMSH